MPVEAPVIIRNQVPTWILVGSYSYFQLGGSRTCLLEEVKTLLVADAVISGRLELDTDGIVFKKTTTHRSAISHGYCTSKNQRLLVLVECMLMARG